MQTSLPKLLITGGNGQIAQAIRYHQGARQFQLIACSRMELDITDINSITKAIELYKPNIIVNTAAYTAVDKAETEQALAMHINYLGTKNLAHICHKAKIPLIHLSTDYVFDGDSKIAYREDAQINPINHYGLSKWHGEQAIREYCEKHIILRVSGVFSEYGHNFAKTILRLAQKQKEIRIVQDQITCPTYAGDIAETIFKLTNKILLAMTDSATFPWGTYHFCSFPAISWYEFAVILINHFSGSPRPLHGLAMTKISSAEYKSRAKRPSYSALACQKIKDRFSIIQPSYDEGIQKIIPWITTNPNEYL